MNKISLYIAGEKVDLDDNSFILFNYTMEDLSNPTIVKNSFSKQITLKGTPANNMIFDSLYRSDRITTAANYDPLRKTPFTIYNELQEIIESGYVKVDSITNNSGIIEYKITLYGGLGSFFYGLTYDEDGNKRTLENMTWRFYDGSQGMLPAFQLNKDVLVNKAWEYIRNGNSILETFPDDCWDIINFAPCYNGFPSDFDAKKVLFAGLIRPFYSLAESDEDGSYYTRKDGCSSALATLAENHTEWEIRNIRPYLQRPVLRMKAIIDAIVIDAAKRGFTVELDSSFFLSSNRIYNRSWITLPLIKKESRYSEDVATAILKSSLSPCDYLLGFAKMCGLVFSCNNNVVKIQSRDTFYSAGQEIDITDRVDADSKEITPVVASHKWYQLGGNKVVGEEAKKYSDSYGRAYGIQKINTGYEFDSEVSELTKDFPFNSAVDVAERNYTNAGYYSITPAASGTVSAFSYHPLLVYEEIKRQFFKSSDNSQNKDFPLGPEYREATLFPSGSPFVDWLPKPQLHGENNKSEGGEHCMLFLVGAKVTPLIQPHSLYNEYLSYYVSDDHPDQDVLNSGTPCWNLDVTKVIKIPWLPSFRRTLDNYTMDWGLSFEDYTGESRPYEKSLYQRYWKSYLTDRYDVDTRIMRCRVNLSGIKVGQDLMKNFFFYDNVLWVLNKIENHSITTDALTECEFIKVKDVSNYTNGQEI